MNKIPTELRRKLFDLLCRNSSPDFIEYLRAYESLPKPLQESFEVSCELLNGNKIDNMRLAILGLRRQDVLRWISACHRQIPLLQDLLFENSTDECFGIGLADYPSGSGVCRIKIYNEYGYFQSQARNVAHIQQLFSILNIPDFEFRKDLELFKIVKLSAIDWDCEGQAMIKVYFGPFHLEQLFGSFSGALFKDDLICYSILREKGYLPEKFQFSIRYSKQGRSLKAEMIYQTRRIVPYLRMFDHKREASKFLVDFYRICPSLTLQVISMQWTPSETMQFYFW